MRKLSVEELAKRDLIEAKYHYPATCKTYNKSGEVIATRTVTHNVEKTKELRSLYPELQIEVGRFRLSKKEPYIPFRLGNIGKE
jgi:hypothetical protein